MSESIGWVKAQQALLGPSRSARVLVGDAAAMRTVGRVAVAKSAR
jgi:hypothetical protein